MRRQFDTGNEKKNEDSDEIFLTPGTDSCLEIHTHESLRELAVQARENNPGLRNLKSFLRLFYARAHACEIDSQGRIRLTKELVELAELEKEVVFVGVGFHWELWGCDRWSNFVNRNQDDFDSIVSTALDDSSGTIAEGLSDPGSVRKIPK